MKNKVNCYILEYMISDGIDNYWLDVYTSADINFLTNMMDVLRKKYHGRLYRIVKLWSY